MKKEKDDSSPVEKNKTSRSLVRKALREERAKLKELRYRTSNGENLAEDIEGCKGQLELLFKEMQSIEEGGHTTFLKAKEVISPKQNIAEKKNRLRLSMDNAKTKIAKIEKALETPNLPKEERDLKLVKSSKLRVEMEDLQQEYNALLQYNHTNFITARDQDRKQIEQTIRVEGLQRKIVSLKEQMKDSATDQDARSYAALEVQLKDTEKMLQDLVAVPEDAFLKESEEDQGEDPFLEK